MGKPGDEKAKQHECRSRHERFQPVLWAEGPQRCADTVGRNSRQTDNGDREREAREIRDGLLDRRLT